MKFDDQEQAVINAIRYIGGVTGRDFFVESHRAAFDRLAAKKVILPCTEYYLAPDIDESLRALEQSARKCDGCDTGCPDCADLPWRPRGA